MSTDRKDYKAAYDKQYRQDNREKLLADKKQWHQENKERVRANKRYKLYGMTPEDWKGLYDWQDGLCAICSKQSATNVDHRHSDNTVRLLLCHNCNLMLGHAKENSDILRLGADYLEETSCR